MVQGNRSRGNANQSLPASDRAWRGARPVILRRPRAPRPGGRHHRDRPDMSARACFRRCGRGPYCRPAARGRWRGPRPRHPAGADSQDRAAGGTPGSSPRSSARRGGPHLLLASSQPSHPRRAARLSRCHVRRPRCGRVPPAPAGGPGARQDLRHPRHRRDERSTSGVRIGADVSALHDDPFQPAADARLHGHRRGERGDRGPGRRVDAGGCRPRDRPVEQPESKKRSPRGAATAAPTELRRTSPGLERDHRSSPRSRTAGGSRRSRRPPRPACSRRFRLVRGRAETAHFSVPRVSGRTAPEARSTEGAR